MRVRAVAGVVLGLAVVALGYNLGGMFGAALGGAVVAGVALLLVRAGALATPRGQSGYRPPPEPPERASARLPRLERIGWMLGWAVLGGRHFEYGARRLLRELLATRLAERRHIDIDADPAAVRAVVGERLWPLVDPAFSYAGLESRVDLALLDDFVTMLEEL